MLLPSALPCDARVARSRMTRGSAQSLFASPPPSDEETSVSSPRNNSLYSTCRALQSMLSPQRSTPSSRQRTALASPIILGHAPTPQSRAHKPAPRPPRGLNKRRRLPEDDLDLENMQDTENHYELRFSTPKRPRIAPEVLPMGLERSDFEALDQATPSRQNEQSPTLDEDWSTEEDRVLVEMVLEKLKLSKTDWSECARSLGKDRGSIGKRWKDLVGEGSVGLKKKGLARRPRIDIRR
ncbi:MAG: hypothetical protein M1814_003222 [Vezdaea aestivalis]|nr:MAG: hypothetical protein M1814_003222 [Vezdaea aestivalis]